jgi:MFS family permease
VGPATLIGVRSYLDFLASNTNLAAFGFVTALASSFGQTFFIGVFSPQIQSEFELSHTAWSTIYLLGTLASAFVLPWTGRQIDRLPLATYATAVWALLAIACIAFSLAPGPVGLVFGIFLLRQAGQGLMSHVAFTTMARFFAAARGRAIAIASLGFAVGEAGLPFLAVFANDALGWRWTYRIGAVLLLAGVGPALALLRRARASMNTTQGRESNTDNVLTQRERATTQTPAASQSAQSPLSIGTSRDTQTQPRSWTRAEVLRDKRFYYLLPGLLCPSLVITAMFFHHLNVADLKGWSHQWVTGSYIVFAIFSTLTSLIAGALIDRFGAIRIVPIMLLPQAVGLLFIVFFDHPLAVLPYLALIGVTTGIGHTAVAALWAELYGVTHIGAIRSLAASLSVFGSALGPVTMGGLMDLGTSAEQVCLVFAFFCLIGTALITLAVSGTIAAQRPI